MTATKKTAAALANFAKAYRSYAEVIGVAGDINVAVQYATQDMFNQIKNITDAATAIATIEDEALYLRETIAKKAAA